MATAAFFQGILGASSLALGALVGVFWQPNRTVSAAIMAFGSGTLICAIAFEITIIQLQLPNGRVAEFRY
ncbi:MULTISPECIES: hypothetical protein [unclassified Moorena]|uniref:hypothetical protein n=1 Tax=unclassified Moorena TaxID=2683338 RepID=UPI0025DB3A2A|nr:MULTISPECIES: hypothetical protein [unclassified Moorena]